ncbi:hypothetical protein [Peterkaempfera griseoplana]|uniref:hypothetical protein n=1 Tax=Peterkaempfera griseoplana TaxID=66896 RepID=UPI0006E142C8|nr:hypothetical protein [Peterkaempfera griseoplana]
MSSFHTLRARVHDTSLPPRRRLSALRSCLQMFAPYGFRTTYHHLVHSVGIPRHLDRDPDSLVRAVDELHTARELWLAAEREYAERRRLEKRAGQRTPAPADAWRVWTRGWGNVSYYCPDPRRHPGCHLTDAVRRGNHRANPASRGSCPLCQGVATVAWADGHRTYQLCAHCGIALSRQQAVHDSDQAAQAARQWRATWQRRDTSM